MKKIFILLFLIVAFGLGAFAYLLGDQYLSPDEIGKLPDDLKSGRFHFLVKRRLVRIYSDVPHKVVFSLYEHLPGIFSLSNPCYFYQGSEGSQIQEIAFPGRFIAEGQTVYCSKGEKAKISSGSSVHLDWDWKPEKPHFYLDKGSIEIVFSKSEILVVSSRLTTIEVEGTQDTNLIVATRTQDGLESFVCNEGTITTSVLRSEENPKANSVIGNKNCNVTIVDKGLEKKKDLAPGTAVTVKEIPNFVQNQEAKTLNANDLLNASDASNSGLPENSPTVNQMNASPSPTTAGTAPRPTSPPKSVTQPGIPTNANSTQISIRPKSPKGEVLEFRYKLSQSPPMVCDLKVGSSANGPFTNAYQFQAPSVTGTLDLQKGFLAYYLMLQCTNGRATISSNVLSPER